VPVAHTPIARAALGPDKLLIPEQAVVVNTDPDDARRVREHLDGGADHVLLQPLGDLKAALRQLESLAPVVLGK
jgi:hypothetical protein